MAPRESESNTYAKFWGDKQRALTLSYVLLFSGVVNGSLVVVLTRKVFTNTFVFSALRCS